RAAGLPELPDVVTAVRMAVRPGEEGPVRGFAGVVVGEIAVLLFEAGGVAFVARLPIQTGLDRGPLVIGGDAVVVVAVVVVPRLEHVEAEPGVVVKPPGRRLA